MVLTLMLHCSTRGHPKPSLLSLAEAGGFNPKPRFLIPTYSCVWAQGKSTAFAVLAQSEEEESEEESKPEDKAGTVSVGLVRCVAVETPASRELGAGAPRVCARWFSRP